MGGEVIGIWSFSRRERGEKDGEKEVIENETIVQNEKCDNSLYKNICLIM